MVKFSAVVPLRGILVAPKAFVIKAAAVTVTEALAVLPLPPSAEVTRTLLFFTPAVVPVTFTNTVHDALDARVAAPKLTAELPAVAVVVPLQVLVKPLGVATIKPAGKLSVKATPVKEMELVAGLTIVKEREVKPFTGIVAAPKVFVIVGGAATERLALAVLPVPPFVEETAPVVLVKFPETAPVALIVKVQLLCAATVAPVSETAAVPATAVAVPPQVFVSPLGVPTTRPTGNVSVKATPISVTALAVGLVIVKVREVVPLSGTPAEPNTLAMEAGATMLMLAEAVPPVPPSPEVTALVVLFAVPAARPVTFMENVHELLPARVAPPRLILFAPAVAVIVPPPQEPVRPFGVETAKPAGKASVKPIPESVAAVLLF